MRAVGAMGAVWLWGALMGACLAQGPATAQELTLETAQKLALDLVNKDRAEHKLPPLKLEAKLTLSAQRHAEDMYKRNYFAHQSPEGKDFVHRYVAAGGDRSLMVAENISVCKSGCKPSLQEATVRKHQRDWMNSPVHRANILRKGIERFGYGVTTGPGGRHYVVQTFAGPGTPFATKVSDAKAISVDQQLRLLAAKINEKRRQAGQQPVTAAPSLTTAAANIAPLPGDPAFAPRHRGDLKGAIPASDGEKWQHLTVAFLQCGGCGTQTTASEIATFAGRWLDDKGPKAFMNADYTHFGFNVAADGKGKKMAVIVLGGAAQQ